MVEKSPRPKNMENHPISLADGSPSSQHPASWGVLRCPEVSWGVLRRGRCAATSSPSSIDKSFPTAFRAHGHMSTSPAPSKCWKLLGVTMGHHGGQSGLFQPMGTSWNQLKVAKNPSCLVTNRSSFKMKGPLTCYPQCLRYIFCVNPFKYTFTVRKTSWASAAETLGTFASLRDSWIHCCRFFCSSDPAQSRGSSAEYQGIGDLKVSQLKAGSLSKPWSYWSDHYCYPLHHS